MICRSVSDLPDLSSARTIISDTEGSGLRPHQGHRMCGIVVGADDSSQGWYVPFRHETGNNLPLENVLRWARELYSDPNKSYCFHNAGFDLGMLRADGIEVAGRLLDTIYLAHVFDSNLFSFEMDFLTRWYLPDFRHTQYERVKEYLARTQPTKKTEYGYGEVQKNYSRIPIEILGPYALEDLEATRQILHVLRKKKFYAAAFNGGRPSWSTRELIQNEGELCRVLFEMQDIGIQFDANRCAELREQALDEIENFHVQMSRLCGFSFKPSQYSKFQAALEAVGGRTIFWMLPEEQRGKQKAQQCTEDKSKSTGRPCFNGFAVIESLRRFKEEGNEKAFEMMRLYREAETRAKICSTFFDNYLEMQDRDRIIHGSVLAHGTETGRLSMRAPNLQQCAKPGGTSDQKTYETLMGHKDADAMNRQVRSLLTARPGHRLVSIDFSQIEYRVAVFLAQDPHMMGLWQNNPNIDYHTATSELIGVDRDRCKTVNFLSLYGGGAKSLAATLTGMGKPTTVAEAKEILNKLFDARPALRQLINRVTEEAKQKGFVQNVFGRVVRVPVGLEYVALNYKDQGTAGDFMRERMVGISKFIKEKNLPVKMLLTVHDELVFEMPTETVRELTPMLIAEQTKCPFMNVPIMSDAEVGVRWSDQVPFVDWVKYGDTGKAA